MPTQWGLPEQAATIRWAGWGTPWQPLGPGSAGHACMSVWVSSGHDHIYNKKDFDRSLVIDEHTELVARIVTAFLRASGDPSQKTIVFCQVRRGASLDR